MATLRPARKSAKLRKLEEITEQGMLYAYITDKLVDGDDFGQQQCTQIDTCCRNLRGGGDGR
jgi:hypothetical protein